MVIERRLKGFTLVELLISIAILSLMVGVATFGFSLFAQHWEGSRGGFDKASGQLQRLDLLTRALDDTLPWVVKDDAGRVGFYFLGRDEGFTLVTSSPIYSVDQPAVVRIFREPEGSSSWRLVYEEAPLDGVLLQKDSQILPFRYRLIVLSGLRKVSFRYFGWESLKKKMTDQDGSRPSDSLRWWPEFNGLIREQQPQVVGLLLNDFEATFRMPEREGALLDRATPMT